MRSRGTEGASPTDQAVLDLAQELQARGGGGAQIALVLGSGLGGIVDALEDAGSVESQELESLPESAVPGHAGRIAWGTLGGVPVLVQEGRIHLYEGFENSEVTRVVRAFARLGVRALILTNTAGGLRSDWPAGTLMRIADQINFQRCAPLSGSRGALGTLYDPGLAEALHGAAQAEELELKSGVYVGLLGPNYETPAEVRMLAKMGGDAVGMSTVAEACVGRDCGLRVAGVTCVTNPGAGLSKTPLNHDEVVEVANANGERLQRLLRAAVPRTAREL